MLGPELPINFESVQPEIDALREQMSEVAHCPLGLNRTDR